MKFKKNGHTLVSEDGKYKIVKDFAEGAYYIKKDGKTLYNSFMKRTFSRQRDAKEFVEQFEKGELCGDFKWV